MLWGEHDRKSWFQGLEHRLTFEEPPYDFFWGTICEVQKASEVGTQKSEGNEATCCGFCWVVLDGRVWRLRWRRSCILRAERRSCVRVALGHWVPHGPTFYLAFFFLLWLKWTSTFWYLLLLLSYLFWYLYIYFWDFLSTFLSNVKVLATEMSCVCKGVGNPVAKLVDFGSKIGHSNLHPKKAWPNPLKSSCQVFVGGSWKDLEHFKSVSLFWNSNKDKREQVTISKSATWVVQDASKKNINKSHPATRNIWGQTFLQAQRCQGLRFCGELDLWRYRDPTKGSNDHDIFLRLEPSPMYKAALAVAWLPPVPIFDSKPLHFCWFSLFSLIGWISDV